MNSVVFKTPAERLIRALKLVFLSAVFLVAALCANAANSSAKFTRTRIYGKEFLRVQTWAKARNLELHWITKDRELRATNSAARLFFTMDSRKAQINGINVSLCLPVLFQGGTVYISAVDIDETIEPILFPEKNNSGKTITTICLDAGHGGKDPGRMDSRMQEKNYTLLLSKEVQRILEKENLKVIQTRARDEYIDLSERTRFANLRKADLFISLHYNAFVNRNVQGVEVFCLTPPGTASSDSEDWKRQSSPVYRGNTNDDENILLAYQVQKSLVKNLEVEDRGVKRAQFVVLLDGKMPSILIEGGFLTNPSEAKRIYDSAYRKKMAQAIADGILAYKKIVEK